MVLQRENISFKRISENKMIRTTNVATPSLSGEF